MIGPPGEGKSLLASAMPGILPRLQDHEKVLLTKVYSAIGALDKDGYAVTRRPMRTVHQTASKQSLLGGGSGMAKPGEITLAHLGVLFLDEVAEFSASTLDALRQPLENGLVTISRVQGTVSYPCRFSLVAAMNPCPCGYYGTDRCLCKRAAVEKYQKKLSGPILDRIDLKVDLERLSMDERFSAGEDNVSPRLRLKVEKARERQLRRFEGKDIPFNAAIPGGTVLEYCEFSPEAFQHYKKKVESLDLTTRSIDRLAKVARTIADLEGEEKVQGEEKVHVQHVDEATGFLTGGNLLISM